MAKLFFKYGTMKSGKTTHLLMTAHNYTSQGKEVMIFTSCQDDRWGKAKVRSRIGIQKEARIVTPNLFHEISAYASANDISCILVDEAQFLTKEDILGFATVVDVMNIPVICYGLKNDFQNNLFEGSKALLEYADEIELIKTVCEFENCNKRATMNMRLLDGKPVIDGEQIQIGDEEYVPLCRKHYFANLK